MRGVTGLLRRRARQGGSEAERLRAAMIPAPVAEAEARPGSLTPEARRQLDEALAKGLAGHRAAAAPVVKTGEPPYSGITAYQLAAYRDAAASELLSPGPGFQPGPSVAPVTAPLPALPANAMVSPPPPAAAPRPVPAESEEMLLLRRVHEAMQRKWRAEAFIADKRALPVFDAITRELGWQGLHVPPRAFGWQRRGTTVWAARERALAAAGHARALAELDEIHARYAAQAQALADGDAA